MIPAVWRLPSGKAHAPEQSGNAAAAGSNRAAWIAFVGFLIFFAGQSGLWAFLERAGREIDVAPADIGVILAILKLVGGLASITAMVAATRFGTRWPFVVAFVGIAAAGAILHFASSPFGYAVGGWIWEYFFTLTFCYATAAVSRYDATGRVVLLLPGAIGLGGAIGPSVAGYLKTGEGFLAVYLFAAITMFLCMCIFLTLGAKRSTA